MDRDLDYENDNIAYDWQYTLEKGGGIKCKNYQICNSILSKDWFLYKGNYLCANCHINFGTWGNGVEVHHGKGDLPLHNNKECPVCLETKQGVEMPRCNHTTCIDCLKDMYRFFDEPDFPYSIEIQDEYEEDPENPVWELYYPLIKDYQEKIDHIDEIAEQPMKDYLSKCPVCRA